MNYTKQKNKTILLGALAVVLLFIGSCAKDKIAVDGTGNLQPLESAKLNSLKQQYDRQENLVLNNDNWLNSLSPDWGKVNVSVVNGRKVYEVSLKNPKRVFATTTVIDKRNAEQLVNSSLTKLLIFEDLKGNLKTCFMELIAFNHPEKLRQLHYKDYKDFDGVVNFYEMNGTLAKGWMITKGKVTAGTKAQGANGLSNGKNSGMQTQAMAPCGTMNVLKWRETCISTTGIEGYGGGSYTECTWEQYSETQTRYCDVPQEDGEGGYVPSGPGGNGGDPEPEPPGTIYIPDDPYLPGRDGDAIDPKKYTKCFKNIPDNGATYKVIVQVQEPAPGTHYNWNVINGVGHTAITLIKQGSNGMRVAQTLGFYPGGNSLSSASKMVDNSDGTNYTIRMEIDMAGNATDFNKIISGIENPPSEYKLFGMNCTSFVVKVCGLGGISLPSAVSTVLPPFGSGGGITVAMTPGGLGYGMRLAKAQGDNRISSGPPSTGNNPASNGPCN